MYIPKYVTVLWYLHSPPCRECFIGHNVVQENLLHPHLPIRLLFLFRSACQLACLPTSATGGVEPFQAVKMRPYLLLGCRANWQPIYHSRYYPILLVTGIPCIQFSLIGTLEASRVWRLWTNGTHGTGGNVGVNLQRLLAGVEVASVAMRRCNTRQSGSCGVGWPGWPGWLWVLVKR